MSGSHELWLSVVNRIIGFAPRGRMIDVCCGACAVTRKLRFTEVESCDALPRNAEVPANWDFTQRNAVVFLRAYKHSYADLVVCSDGIEHMTKQAGHELLREMTRVGKIAIIFTPTGDATFDPKATAPHTHKSSWREADFHELGWETEHYPDWHPTLGWGGLFAWKKSI